MARRGNPGDDVKGGFLGGARSPRPRCKALLMPRHFITRGGWPWPNEGMPRSSRCLPPGVRSPPLRGGRGRGEVALQGRPEMTRKPIFSEGRAPRVRIVRPCKWQGIASPTGALRLGPWPNGGQCCAWRDASFAGVRSPPLRGGGLCKLERPCGGRPGDGAEGGFLGGAHSVRPHCQAVPKPRHNIINGGKGNARGSNEVIPRWKQSLIYGRAEPAPPLPVLPTICRPCGPRASRGCSTRPGRGGSWGPPVPDKATSAHPRRVLAGCSCARAPGAGGPLPFQALSPRLGPATYSSMKPGWSPKSSCRSKVKRCALPASLLRDWIAARYSRTADPRWFP